MFARFAFILMITTGSWALAQDADDGSPGPAPAPPAVLVAPPSAAPDVSFPSNSSSDLEPPGDAPNSYWAENCQSTMGQQLTDLRLRTEKRAKVKKRKDVESQLDDIEMDVFKKAIAGYQKMESAGPLPEVISIEGGDRRIAEAYNQFGKASHDFMDGFDPKTESGLQHHRCATTAVRPTHKTSAFASHVQTTKKFLIVRYMFSRYAKEAMDVKRGNKELEEKVKDHFSKAIKSLEGQIASCPQNIWKQSKDAFPRPASADKAPKTCGDFASYRKSVDLRFDHVIKSFDEAQLTEASSAQDPPTTGAINH